jgi:hypothetical protein
MVCHLLVSESAAAREDKKTTTMAAAEQEYDLVDQRSLLQAERLVAKSGAASRWSSRRAASQPTVLGDTDLRVVETARRQQL